MKKRAPNIDNEPGVPVSAKAPKIVKSAVQAIAQANDRSFSNTLVRLLQEHPQVKKKIRELAA